MILRDIRYAIRSLVIDRGVTAVVILCLALGIGINATLFSIVDGVMLQPLPYKDAAQLVALNETFERGGVREAWVSYPNLQDWKAQTKSFAAIVSTAFRSLALSDNGLETERLSAGATTWDLFPTLGVVPALGRLFNADDDRPGAEPVAIISDEVWTRRYNRDPSIVGRRVLLNARPYTIVGVMPPKFQFPENQKLWVPLAPLEYTARRDAFNLYTFARLNPGVSIAAASTELQAVAQRLAQQYPDTNKGRSALVRPLSDEFIPDDVRLILSTMMGAVTLVLLIACANVANLMLSRAASRQREFSVRAALGAGRARVIRQLLTECLILGIASAPLGLLVARYGIYLMDGAVPPDDVPYYIHWELSARGIAYTLGISAIAGLVFGLAPALQAGRLSLQEALRDGARGSGQSGRRARLRNGLVIFEVAMSLVLLVGASLFIRSFWNLQTANAGFDTAPLLTLRIYMPDESYTRDQKQQRTEDIVRRIESLPGVTAAFSSNYIPLSGGGSGGNIAVDGQTFAKGEEPNIGFNPVTPHMIRTLGMRLQGRDFTDAEGISRSTVAIINETMANKFWAGKDPLGQRFRLLSGVPTAEWFTVIGVAPDVRSPDVDNNDPPRPVAFVALPYGVFPSMGFTIRASGNPANLTAAVRNEIRSSDANLAVFQVQTMEQVRTSSFWQYRLFGYMFGIFGAAALFLAAVGVYSVLSFSVSQRTQEIGVRLALGAQQSDVRRLVVGQGVTLAAIGVVAGLIGAFGVTRVIASQLYNVTPTDPLSFVGVSLFLSAIAAVASYVPARRATRVDPIVALRID